MAEPAVLTAHFFGTFRVSVDGTPETVELYDRLRQARHPARSSA
jgi:hypothetical protein